MKTITENKRIIVICTVIFGLIAVGIIAWLCCGNGNGQKDIPDAPDYAAGETEIDVFADDEQTGLTDEISLEGSETEAYSEETADVDSGKKTGSSKSSSNNNNSSKSSSSSSKKTGGESGGQKPKIVNGKNNDTNETEIDLNK